LAVMVATVKIDRTLCVCAYQTIATSSWATDYRQHCAQRNAPAYKLLRGRFWGFSPRRGDTLHRWGRNLAQRRGPKVQL